jgi:hypothetical protein
MLPIDERIKRRRAANGPRVIANQSGYCRISMLNLSYINKPHAEGDHSVTLPNPDALSISHKALRALITLNWLFGAGILALLIWTLFAGEWVGRALGVDTNPRALIGMRLIMLLGVAAIPIGNVFFSQLLSIVETVRAGDPFVASNASRLHAIAWAVLALEIGRFVIVAIANSVSTPARPIHLDSKFSITPWLAVLLLFVLARVFEHGARMRDELAATI